MNGGPQPSRASRVFLGLGALVVAIMALRVVRAGFAALTFLHAAPDAGSGSPTSPGRFAVPDPAALALGAALLLAAAMVIARGALRRRPWARPVSIAALALATAAALTVAAIQILALARTGAPSPEAAEIGYGRILSFWRIAGAGAALLLAVFCGAALRRLTSSEMRREFPDPASRFVPPPRR
jgi:hypothetical protein